MTSPTRTLLRLVMATVVFVALAGELWLPAAASAAPAEPLARALGAAPEIFDFLLINVGDPDGDAVSFPAGQEVCLAVTISPPLTPGGTPFITHCYGDLPGRTQHGNQPATPFLRSSSYSIAVASNTTGCDVALPAMSPQDYGPGSGWYAIFNVTVTCPEAPLPTVVIPDPTRIVPLPTITIPTPAPTIDSTSPTDVPLVEGYERVTLRFVPAIPGVTPVNLPGEVCARIVADPPLTGDALTDHCHTRSTAFKDYFPTEGTSFPMASVYSAIVASNESGCTATPGAFREYLRDFGEAAELDVIIDCLGSSATEISGESEYADLSVHFTDGSTALRTYPGQLCVQVSVSPPLPSGSWVGTMCESQTPEITIWHSSEYVSLPVSSTYTATVVSNETGCTATPDVGVVNEVVDGRTVGRMTVRLDCAGAPETPLPPPYEAVHVEVRDSTGLYRYYDAELCFDVAIAPDTPVVGNDWVCTYYAPATGTSLTILPGAGGLPVTSTYTANVFSNETGCDVAQSFRAEADEGYITILVTCPEPEAYSGVRLELFDTGGEETVALDGELCVEVRSLPVLPPGPQVGELCTTSVEASDSWLPTGSATFPHDNAYASYVTSNASSCTTGPIQRSLTTEDGGLVLVLSMGVTCAANPATTTPGATATPTGTPGSTATTEPTPTATAVATSHATTVPGTVSPTATDSPSPTIASTVPGEATSTSTSPPSPTAPAVVTEAPLDPTSTLPPGTDRTPATRATPTDGSTVTGLPTTGGGSIEGVLPIAFFLAAVGLLLMVGGWAARRSRARW